MQILKSTIEPAPLTPNIATMLRNSHNAFADNPVFAYKKDHRFEKIVWKDLYKKILLVAHHLKQEGFAHGDKMVIYSPNRLEMLIMELAAMACGGIAVPIFAYFKKDTANLLIKFCDAQYLAVAGDFQISQLEENLSLKKIFVFDHSTSIDNKKFFPFTDLLSPNPLPNEEEVLAFDLPSKTICLNMYTSGTMGLPKCVQLTHENILSQQAALDKLWNINKNDRFLSYLPWHHSFGGIFELFNVLYRGACYHLEPSYGKDPLSIIENWKIIKPTVFFSVPKIYKALIEEIHRDPSFEEILFHPELKFIFTAAAPLPENTAAEFDKRNIPIIEGWGLTETSPCCTLTQPGIKRIPGVVGFPIPGVELRLDEEGEIQVKGPNIMAGYYKNEEANKNVFTEDGWFRTGDIGEFTPTGLKLISRKDRIFKLSNGEKVVPTDIEKIIEKKCHYISYAVVYGNGKEYPVAILFPNKKMLEHPNFEITPDEGCFCPRSIEELGRCLCGCLQKANEDIKQKFSKIKLAGIINAELSVDDNTLTPSLKVAPKNVINKYLNEIKALYGEDVPAEKDIYIIILDEQLKQQRCHGRD